MKRVIKRVLLFIWAVLLFGAISFASLASDEATGELTLSQDAVAISGQVTTLETDAKAYKEKDTSSEEVASFSAGDSVFLVAEEDGWYKIFYKGENLYIPTKDLSQETVEEAKAQAEELAKSVQDELDQQQKEDEAYVELYERYERGQRNALIWKIVIAALVVAIIAISVVIAINNNKKNQENKKS